MALEGPKLRAGWLTLLDTLLVGTASAALVAALGAHTRFDLAGARVTIRAATNLLYAVVALGALRVWLGGALRLFPAVARSDIAAFAPERERFATPEPISRRVLICAIACGLGSIIWILPHIRHPRMVPDYGDPLFSAWRIARIAHQLVTDPRHLFDGNIFFPLPLTMTLSDSTFLQALLGTPFVLAGADPLVVANALTMVAFPLCGLAFFYAGWRLTGDPLAAIVGGLLGAWYPFHAEHYSHLELQWVMFAPLAAIGGLRLLADPRPRTGLWFGAAVAAQWLASMYLGVMLISFLVPFLAVTALAWRVRPTKQMLAALLAAAAVALPAFAGLAWPYVQARDVRGDRAIEEVRDGSATGRNYVQANMRLVNYRWQGGRGHKVERELFPGTSTIALAAIGVIPPLGGPAMAAIVAGALTFDWSLGLNGLTYDELYALSPVYRGMRMTARFSVIAGVALVLLATTGTSRLLRRVLRPNLRAAACALLSVIVLVDLRMDPGLSDYHAGIPPIYAGVTPEMVLIDLPPDPQIDYMYFSTYHWARLVGGYSGFPRYSTSLMDGWKAWPAPASIAFFKQAGATHLTYNCALEERPWRCATALDMLDAHPGLERRASGLWQGKETRLYRLR
jgi:hypothetical protein